MRSGSTRRSSIARPISSRSPRKRPATSAPRLPRLATACSMVNPWPRRSARALAVSTRQCGCTSVTRSAGGHGQFDDFERIVAADQHEAAEQARRRVVGVRRARRRPLAGERVGSSSRFDSGRPNSSLTAIAPGDAARRRAAEPARQRHLLVHAQPDAAERRRSAWSGRGSRWDSTDCAATPATFCGGSRVSCPPSPVTSAMSSPGSSANSAVTTSPGFGGRGRARRSRGRGCWRWLGRRRGPARASSESCADGRETVKAPSRRASAPRRHGSFVQRGDTFAERGLQSGRRHQRRDHDATSSSGLARRALCSPPPSGAQAAAAARAGHAAARRQRPSPSRSAASRGAGHGVCRTRVGGDRRHRPVRHRRCRTCACPPGPVTREGHDGARRHAAACRGSSGQLSPALRVALTSSRSSVR